MEITTITNVNPDDSKTDYVIIDRGNGKFTSMTKAHYDQLQSQEVTNEPR